MLSAYNVLSAIYIVPFNKCLERRLGLERAVRRGDGGLSLLTLQEVQDMLVVATLLATEERRGLEWPDCSG